MPDNREDLINLDNYLKNIPVSDDAHKADVLLLTCMDFRFFLKIAELMKGIRYDHVILAGAALGAVVPGKEKWHQTFFDHVDLAVKLHEVPSVLVMEHRDCGAYSPKGFGLLPFDPPPDREREVHFEQAAILHDRIPRFLGFNALLLDKPTEAEASTCDRLI